MSSRYLSAASAMQLAVLTAMLALCVNLYTGLSAHETRLHRLYGDRVFSARAFAVESGSPYRFDRHDMTVLREGLESEGIAVAGLSLSHIDAREVDPVLDGTPIRSHQLRTRIALVDVMPLYFDIADIPVRLSRPDSGLTDGQECFISRDLASALFHGTSPVGHSVAVSGGRQLVVVDEVMSDHLLPMIDEPTPAGLLHRPGRFVIYRPLADPYAAASYEYLLFEIQGDVGLMDGMKSVSRLLTTHRPELQSDVYSEYERFREQSVSTRSALIVVIAAALIGCAIAGIGVHAEMTHCVTAGRHEIAARMMVGAAPSSVVALVFRRALVKGVLAGAAGCVLYCVVSAIGVSLPALPSENIGVRVVPAVVSAAAAVLTASAAAVGPARRAFAVDPSTCFERTCFERPSFVRL